MVENLIDELDGRLLRITIAYPGLEREVQKIKKHTRYAISNSRDRYGDAVNLDKTLKTAVKASLEMVRKYPELKQDLKPIIVKAVNYLEPKDASTNKH